MFISAYDKSIEVVLIPNNVLGVRIIQLHIVRFHRAIDAAANIAGAYLTGAYQGRSLLLATNATYMFTKQQKFLQRQWVNGTINLVAAARRLGYRKASLTKGVQKVKSLLTEMGITVL
jgi:hypothetical protein